MSRPEKSQRSLIASTGHVNNILLGNLKLSLTTARKQILQFQTNSRMLQLYYYNKKINENKGNFMETNQS